jgi:hypothetical protein
MDLELLLEDPNGSPSAGVRVRSSTLKIAFFNVEDSTLAKVTIGGSGSSSSLPTSRSGWNADFDQATNKSGLLGRFKNANISTAFGGSLKRPTCSQSRRPT